MRILSPNEVTHRKRRDRALSVARRRRQKQIRRMAKANRPLRPNCLGDEPAEQANREDTMDNHLTRRGFMGTAAGAGVMLYGGNAMAQLKMPTSPVTLNDRRRRRQPGADAEGHRELSRGEARTSSRASPSPRRRRRSCRARSRRSRTPDRVDIDLVLTGTDALAAGIEQELWDAAAAGRMRRSFPKLDDNYLPGRAKMQELAQGQGVVVTYYARRVRCSNTSPTKVKHAADAPPKSCWRGARPIRTA